MAAIRASVLEDFAWIAGDWTFENSVPATRLSPAYADAGRQRFAIADSWVCAGLPGGRLEQHITFDPFRQEMDLFTDSWILCAVAFGPWMGRRSDRLYGPDDHDRHCMPMAHDVDQVE